MLSIRCIGAFLTAAIVALPAYAQQTDPEKAEKSSSFTPTVSLHTTDPEVLQPERGAANSAAIPPPPIALEGPLDPQRYICGRGDTFDFNFWGQQNFKVRVTADLEGRTFIPKIGYVEVVGKTLAEAREIIKKAVHRYYPGLNFDFSLAIPRTFLVHVVGNVKKPGSYPATPLQSVSTIVAAASPGTNGSRRKIEIRRRDGSKLTADLVLYELTGDLKYNPPLADGDIINVPNLTLAATLNGAVNRPGHYELVASDDLAELLTLGGGFKPSRATTVPIGILRREPNDSEKHITIPFPPDGSLPNAPLHDGDIVSVADAAERQQSILFVGPVPGATNVDEVTAVRRMPYFEGATVRLMLEQIGEVGASADLKSGYIRSESGKIVPVDLEALLVRRDLSADRPLSVGDSIVIPQRRRGVAVEGSVLKPSIYPHNPSLRAGQYVGLAGGPRSAAQSPDNYRIVTADGHERRFSPNLILDPGDTVVVPERSFSRSEVVSLVLAGAGLFVSTFTLVYLVAFK